MTTKEDKMLLQLTHKWTIYIFSNNKDNKPLFTLAKQFIGNWSVMHTRFKLISKLLDFNTLRRDTTLVGYYYVRKGGDCLICLPDNLKPENIYG